MTSTPSPTAHPAHEPSDSAAGAGGTTRHTLAYGQILYTTPGAPPGAAPATHTPARLASAPGPGSALGVAGADADATLEGDAGCVGAPDALGEPLAGDADALEDVTRIDAAAAAVVVAATLAESGVAAVAVGEPPGDESALPALGVADAVRTTGAGVGVDAAQPSPSGSARPGQHPEGTMALPTHA